MKNHRSCRIASLALLLVATGDQTLALAFDFIPVVDLTDAAVYNATIESRDPRPDYFYRLPHPENPIMLCPGIVLEEDQAFCTSRAHGTCDVRSGICFCNEGFQGESCSICVEGYAEMNSSCQRDRSCPTHCSMGGLCDPRSGICSCYEGRTGSSCSNSVYSNETMTLSVSLLQDMETVEKDQRSQTFFGFKKSHVIVHENRSLLEFKVHYPEAVTASTMKPALKIIIDHLTTSVEDVRFPRWLSSNPTYHSMKLVENSDEVTIWVEMGDDFLLEWDESFMLRLTLLPMLLQDALVVKILDDDYTEVSQDWTSVEPTQEIITAGEVSSVHMTLMTSTNLMLDPLLLKSQPYLMRYRSNGFGTNWMHDLCSVNDVLDGNSFLCPFHLNAAGKHSLQYHLLREVNAMTTLSLMLQAQRFIPLSCASENYFQSVDSFCAVLTAEDRMNKAHGLSKLIRLNPSCMETVLSYCNEQLLSADENAMMASTHEAGRSLFHQTNGFVFLSDTERRTRAMTVVADRISVYQSTVLHNLPKTLLAGVTYSITLLLEDSFGNQWCELLPCLKNDQLEINLTITTDLQQGFAERVSIRESPLVMPSFHLTRSGPSVIEISITDNIGTFSHRVLREVRPSQTSALRSTVFGIDLQQETLLIAGVPLMIMLQLHDSYGNIVDRNETNKLLISITNRPHPSSLSSSIPHYETSYDEETHEHQIVITMFEEGLYSLFLIHDCQLRLPFTAQDMLDDCALITGTAYPVIVIGSNLSATTTHPKFNETEAVATLPFQFQIISLDRWANVASRFESFFIALFEREEEANQRIDCQESSTSHEHLCSFVPTRSGQMRFKILRSSETYEDAHLLAVDFNTTFIEQLLQGGRIYELMITDGARNASNSVVQGFERQGVAGETMTFHVQSKDSAGNLNTHHASTVVSFTLEVIKESQSNNESQMTFLSEHRQHGLHEVRFKIFETGNYSLSVFSDATTILQRFMTSHSLLILSAAVDAERSMVLNHSGIGTVNETYQLNLLARDIHGNDLTTPSDTRFLSHWTDLADSNFSMPITTAVFDLSFRPLISMNHPSLLLSPPQMLHISLMSHGWISARFWEDKQVPGDYRSFHLKNSTNLLSPMNFNLSSMTDLPQHMQFLSWLRVDETKIKRGGDRMEVVALLAGGTAWIEMTSSDLPKHRTTKMSLPVARNHRTPFHSVLCDVQLSDWMLIEVRFQKQRETLENIAEPFFGLRCRLHDVEVMEEIDCPLLLLEPISGSPIMPQIDSSTASNEMSQVFFQNQQLSKSTDRASVLLAHDFIAGDLLNLVIVIRDAHGNKRLSCQDELLRFSATLDGSSSAVSYQHDIGNLSCSSTGDYRFQALLKTAGIVRIFFSLNARTQSQRGVAEAVNSLFSQEVLLLDGPIEMTVLPSCPAALSFLSRPLVLNFTDGLIERNHNLAGEEMRIRLTALDIFGNAAIFDHQMSAEMITLEEMREPSVSASYELAMQSLQAMNPEFRLRIFSAGQFKVSIGLVCEASGAVEYITSQTISVLPSVVSASTTEIAVTNETLGKRVRITTKDSFNNLVHDEAAFEVKMLSSSRQSLLEPRTDVADVVNDLLWYRNGSYDLLLNSNTDVLKLQIRLGRHSNELGYLDRSLYVSSTRFQSSPEGLLHQFYYFGTHRTRRSPDDTMVLPIVSQGPCADIQALPSLVLVTGFFRPRVTGEHRFRFRAEQEIVTKLFVSGRLVFHRATNGTSSGIRLAKDLLYEIRIEMIPEQCDNQYSWFYEIGMQSLSVRLPAKAVYKGAARFQLTEDIGFYIETGQKVQISSKVVRVKRYVAAELLLVVDRNNSHNEGGIYDLYSGLQVSPLTSDLLFYEALSLAQSSILVL